MGGQAPGPDGITYGQLSPREIGEIAGELSEHIRNGTYRPGPTRKVSIPKRSGEGHRGLSLANISDRAVMKALHGTLQPILDAVFMDNSYGFRPERGTWGLLADLEARMKDEDCWVVVAEDVQKAFDSVRISDVLDAHRRIFEDKRVRRYLPRDASERERLLDWITKVLQGNDPKREKGIDQGNPYSPLALNVLLHFIHDVPISEQGEIQGWWRYTDDLTYLCQSAAQGRKVLGQARGLLRGAKLQLKGKGGVYDLRQGDAVQVLRLTVRKAGEDVEIGLADEAMDSLRDRLERCHENENPQASAKAVLEGWLASAAPAFPSAQRRMKQILDLAAKAGFREIGTPRKLLEHWEDSWHGWQWQRERAKRGRREDRDRDGIRYRRGRKSTPEAPPF